MPKHTQDKPKDCRYCYFWKKSTGCTYKGKTGCYYEPENTAPVTECTNCPYKRSGPCIGWCTREVLRSVGLMKERGHR